MNYLVGVQIINGRRKGNESTPDEILLKGSDTLLLDACL